MKAKHLAKMKSLAQELLSCVEAYEGSEGDEMTEDNAPEPEDEGMADKGDKGDDDLAAKSLKMKLGKYKGMA